MTKKSLALILAGCMAISMTACSGEKTKDVQIELVQDVEEISYVTAVVERGEVVSEVKLNCNYLPTEQEDLAFTTDEGLIAQAHVKEGSLVEKGDVLVELYVDDLEDKLDEAEYQLASLKLQLEQTQEMKAFDIESANILYEYTSKTSKDKEALQEKLDGIEEQYKITLEDLNDAIMISEKKVAEYRQELEDSKLVAGMSGEVTYVLKELLNLEYNMPAVEADKKLITISNLDSFYFVVEDTTYAEYIQTDDVLTVNYSMSGVTSRSEVVPANMESWDEDGAMYFKVTGDEILENGMYGDIILELERKEDVLCVPTKAIHDSDEGAFVYIEENGLLSMRYVTVGLRGLEMTEITDGLKEGETVVLK